ncbi:helix-turn-helix domain-containing protein [Nonomuraea sp. NPDC049480]|uniref:helix-turn-helix domain-containing protein n=1 Tax=Nonomuraea sp. NPDC049480 TaxID=3364353 RepID=UPI0037AAC6E8
MDQGFSSREACRIVGINLRTGKRWRNGRAPNKAKKKGAPPVKRLAGPPSGVSRYLREDERIYIADRVREKASIREIARELGRALSTISREVRRNRHPTNGQYRPHVAQARADARLPTRKTLAGVSDPGPLLHGRQPGRRRSRASTASWSRRASGGFRGAGQPRRDAQQRRRRDGYRR